MTTKTDSLNHRISSSYKQLTQAATELNAVSDELGKFVTALDSALRRLNLGIATWLRLESREDGSGNYTKRDLGYAKIGNKWGIALRTMSGNHNDVEDSNVEEWLFNDAPRALAHRVGRKAAGSLREPGKRGRRRDQANPHEDRTSSGAGNRAD